MQLYESAQGSPKLFPKRLIPATITPTPARTPTRAHKNTGLMLRLVATAVRVLSSIPRAYPSSRCASSLAPRYRIEIRLGRMTNRQLLLAVFSSTLFAACAGDNGSDGIDTLVASSAEEAGENCPNGGLRLDFGADTDGDAQLSADEVTSTNFVCDGNDGLQSLLSTVELAPGLVCGFGGFRVDYGIDDSVDGVLDAGEIDGNELFCNDNCPTGLVAITKNFTDQGTFNTPLLDDGELTVEASPGNVALLNFNGLGAADGGSPFMQSGESITFTFVEPAFDVSFSLIAAGNTNANTEAGERTIEASGLDDASFGSIEQSGTGTFDIAAPTRQTAMRRFTDVVTVDTHLVGSVTYSVCRL